MRLLFTAALIFFMFWHCWRNPMKNRKRIGSRYAKPIIPVKLLLTLSVLLLIIGGSEARWLYFQSTASSALKEVTGNPNATLKCQRLANSWIDMDSASIGGKVYGDTVNIAHMKHKQCADLFSWMQSMDKDSPSQDQVSAVHVLTHEGIHTTGEFNEAITECTAIQRDAMMATALGGSEATGLSLQKNYYEDLYPRMPSAYILDGCAIDPQFDSLLSTPEDGS